MILGFYVFYCKTHEVVFRYVVESMLIKWQTFIADEKNEEGSSLVNFQYFIGEGGSSVLKVEKTCLFMESI